MVQFSQQPQQQKASDLKARHIRRYFAAVSVGILVLVAAFAFANLQGTYSGPPPILDPNFKLWADSSTGPQLMVWGRESVKGSFDRVALNETVANGRNAVELSVFQSGEGSGSVYEALTQTLDGGRLSALLNSTVGLWFMKEPCHCDDDPFNTTAVTLVVEVNDGIHTISILFSDKFTGILTLLNHRIEFRPAPSGTWTFEEFDFAKDYAAAHWLLPNSLTFRVIFGVAEGSLGWHYAYLERITILSNSLPISQTTILSLTLLPAALTSRHSD
jgi:hypothetical protein